MSIFNIDSPCWKYPMSSIQIHRSSSHPTADLLFGRRQTNWRPRHERVTDNGWIDFFEFVERPSILSRYFPATIARLGPVRRCTIRTFFCWGWESRRDDQPPDEEKDDGDNKEEWKESPIWPHVYWRISHWAGLQGQISNIKCVPWLEAGSHAHRIGG